MESVFIMFDDAERKRVVKEDISRALLPYYSAYQTAKVWK